MKKLPLIHWLIACSAKQKRQIHLLAMIYLLVYPASGLWAQDNTWFADVSHQLGFNVVHANGVLSMDVNNDNYPDLMTQFGGQFDTGHWRLYINQQDPNNPNDTKARIFMDVTQNSGINEPGLIKDFAAAADYNNDGNIDLLLTTWYMDSATSGQSCVPNPDNGSRIRLLLGDGQGHFTHKTNSNLESLGPQASGSLLSLDYDKDGKLDIYIGSHYKNWCYGVVPPSHLLKGNGDGTFTDVTASSGINYAPLPQFGGNIADWNDDCNPDILTCPYTIAGPGNLFKNNGNGTFTDVGGTAGFDPHFMAGDNGQAMVPWAAMPCDYDNDGDLDFFMLEVHGGTGANEGRSTIFTSGGAANNYKLTPNLNQIVRSNPQNTHHGDHNGCWIDFDNDGWVDLLVGDAVYTITPATDGQRMFFCQQNSTTHQFNDITRSLGFITAGTIASISDRIRRPSVMIPVDYDNDGDDDIIKTCTNTDDSLNFLVLRNDIANKSHYIKIKLDAFTGVNKSCIGAKVRVKTGSMWQSREVYGNQGHFTNQYPLMLTFGMGDNTHIDSIDVRWPDAACTHTIITNIQADQFISINKDGLDINNVEVTGAPFTVYPNPIANELIIHATGGVGKQQVIIRNIQGQIMTQLTLQYGDKRINTSGWATGTYLVQCYDGEKYNTVKVIKIN